MKKRGCVGCGRPASNACPWKQYRMEEGQRVYTGKRCDLAMCDECGTVVSGKRLCKWHGRKAEEMGIT